MKDRRQKKGNGLPPTLRLTIHSDGLESEHFVENTVTIGRDENAEVYVDHPLVSRRHAELLFEHGSWWLRDLQSRNGTFIAGQKIAEAPLAETTAFTLGRDGPEVIATLESAPAA